MVCDIVGCGIFYLLFDTDKMIDTNCKNCGAPLTKDGCCNHCGTYNKVESVKGYEKLTSYGELIDFHVHAFIYGDIPLLFMPERKLRLFRGAY